MRVLVAVSATAPRLRAVRVFVCVAMLVTIFPTVFMILTTFLLGTAAMLPTFARMFVTVFVHAMMIFHNRHSMT